MCAYVFHTDTQMDRSAHTQTHTSSSYSSFLQFGRLTAILLWAFTALSMSECELLSMSFRGPEAATKLPRKDAIKAEVWVQGSRDWPKQCHHIALDT